MRRNIVDPNASATGGVRGGTGRREEDTTRERGEVGGRDGPDVQLHSRSVCPNGYSHPTDAIPCGCCSYSSSGEQLDNLVVSFQVLDTYRTLDLDT